MVNLKFTKAIFVHFPVLLKGGRPIIDTRNKEVLKHFIPHVEEIALSRLDILKSSLRAKLWELLKIVFGREVSTQEVVDKCGEIDGKTLVFASHSTYGLLVYKIKHYCPEVFVVTFFHNIESQVYWKNFKKTGRLSELRNYFIACFTEKLSVRYSDRLVVLNNRDRKLLVDKYGYTQTYLLPTSLKDRFVETTNCKPSKERRLRLLFVGTHFIANEQGMRWMVKYIVPYIDADFYIVGQGMEKLRPYAVALKNVFIVGEVDAAVLDEYYYKADIFISPLFMGGGMKTKVAEAMMFGLPIIGTRETFVGYEEDVDKIGFCSDSAVEMIAFLKKCIKYPGTLLECSTNARRIFLSKYSVDSSVLRMSEIIAS